MRAKLPKISKEDMKDLEEIPLQPDNKSIQVEAQVSLFGHDKKYDIILADPPWNIRWQGSNSIGTKPLQYPTLLITELCQLPVKAIANDCSKLFLWTTKMMMKSARLMICYRIKR